MITIDAEQVSKLARKLRNFRNMEVWCKTKANEIQAKLVEITGPGVKFVAPPTDTEKYGIQVTRVDFKPTKHLDIAKLRSMLTEKQWDYVTSMVLDERKLESALAKGTVPMSIYNECVSYKEGSRKPYFKCEVADANDYSGED